MQGADKRPIVDARGAENGAANNQLGPKSGFSPAFTALRRNLNRITTAKHNHTAAVIVRLADLYDRLADCAESRGNRVTPPDEAKPREGDPPSRS